MNTGRIATASMAAVGLMGGFALGHTTANGEPEVISACVGSYDFEDPHAGGVLRIPEPGSDGCMEDETPILWDVSGPTGATGAQGPQGQQGAQGAQGDPGAQGTQGQQGAKGDPGAQGQQGQQGAQGAQGAKGASGASSAPGTVVGLISFDRIPGIRGDATLPVYRFRMKADYANPNGPKRVTENGELLFNPFGDPSITLDPGASGGSLLTALMRADRSGSVVVRICDVSEVFRGRPDCEAKWTTKVELGKVNVLDYDALAYDSPTEQTTITLKAGAVTYSTRRGGKVSTAEYKGPTGAR